MSTFSKFSFILSALLFVNDNFCSCYRLADNPNNGTRRKLSLVIQSCTFSKNKYDFESQGVKLFRVTIYH